MLHKYEHNKHSRTRAWRRFKQDCIVKNKLKTDKRYAIRLCYFSYVTDGDIEYGEMNWTDLLAKWEAHAAKTSFSYRKSRWDYDKEYNRARYKKETKRWLYEEGFE